MMNSNWMVRYSTVYRKFLSEQLGLSKTALDAMDFNDLQRAIKPHQKTAIYAPYKLQFQNFRGVS
jgi:hypothetical protein